MYIDTRGQDKMSQKSGSIWTDRPNQKRKRKTRIGRQGLVVTSWQRIRTSKIIKH